ncbi:MAG: hypothetical protein ACLGIC_04675 [Acidimicrobiia bacterium]
MAHVQKRHQGGKTTWRARVRLPDGRERSKSFNRKVDAERWVVETQAQLNRGNVIDPRAGQITLAEYAAQWHAAQMHRPCERAADVAIDDQWNSRRVIRAGLAVGS